MNPELKQQASAWPTAEYDHVDRAETILGIAEKLAAGIPGEVLGGTDGQDLMAHNADVVNACWVARAEEYETPYQRLSTKTLEDIEFITRWSEKGGFEAPSSRKDTPRDPGGGVLSAAQLDERLVREGEGSLVITPLLPGAVSGASVDLRLGNGFIVFVRSRAASFDPVEADSDPRSIQRYVELAWGERFNLHPGELVLASTLEYLAMPGDLTAQVITRSSMGRLGLLSATAVQIHPHFHGCLTLELANLGTLPLVLSPGERIAQLVVSTMGTAVEKPTGKYYYGTGPEFSRVRDDLETRILRKFRDE